MIWGYPYFWKHPYIHNYTYTLPETNIFAPTNGWLADDPFLLGKPIFRGDLMWVSGRVSFSSRHFWVDNDVPFQKKLECVTFFGGFFPPYPPEYLKYHNFGPQEVAQNFAKNPITWGKKPLSQLKLPLLFHQCYWLEGYSNSLILISQTTWTIHEGLNTLTLRPGKHCTLHLPRVFVLQLWVGTCWDFSLDVHPWRLTWNIIMEVGKIIFLSKWVICRFHVNLPGCKVDGNMGVSNNRGIFHPKWMVKISWKTLRTNGWFGGFPIIFGNTHMNFYKLVFYIWRKASRERSGTVLDS